MSSLLIAFCVIGSLTANPSTTIPAGIPTEVMSRFVDEYVPIEDAYTKDELYWIYRVVETETYCQSVESKSHVASVVFNMINDKDKRFGKTVKRVVTKPGHYSYWRKKITKTTKEAVVKAYEENTAPDCFAFHSGKFTKRHAGFSYKFSDKAGHHFYGE